MNITQKRRKLISISAIVLAVIYFTPYVVRLARQSANMRPNAQRSPSRTRPSPFRDSAPILPVAEPLPQSEDRAAAAQSSGFAIADISGVWVDSINAGEGITASYRMDFVQKGNIVSGRSRRDVKGPFGYGYVIFPITGTSIDNGRRFNLQEGPVIESFPPDRPWCVIRSMTLVPTGNGTVVGSYEGPPCQAGTITLHRTK